MPLVVELNSIVLLHRGQHGMDEVDILRDDEERTHKTKEEGGRSGVANVSDMEFKFGDIAERDGDDNTEKQVCPQQGRPWKT